MPRRATNRTARAAAQATPGPAASESASRKRARDDDPDATSAPQPARADSAHATEPEPKRKRRKGKAKEEEKDDGEGEQDAAPPHLASRALEPESSAASSTLAASQSTQSPDEATDAAGEAARVAPMTVDPPAAADGNSLALDAMSPEQRRLAKGKGKAKDDSTASDEATAEQLARLQHDLASRDEVSPGISRSLARVRERYLDCSGLTPHVSRACAGHRLADGNPRVPALGRHLHRLPRTARSSLRAPVRSRLVSPSRRVFTVSRTDIMPTSQLPQVPDQLVLPTETRGAIDRRLAGRRIVWFRERLELELRLGFGFELELSLPPGPGRACAGFAEGTERAERIGRCSGGWSRICAR